LQAEYDIVICSNPLFGSQFFRNIKYIFRWTIF